jgi:predicted DNA-binding transcriptional regulator YafY
MIGKRRRLPLSAVVKGEDGMRADRLLSILLLLQVHRRLTAGELARRLEVSMRTIHRDMEALSGAGVPVVAERGTGGGWHLLEEYRTNLTGLSDTEVQALFLATPTRVFADLGLAKVADAALIKLSAALPSRHRHSAEDVRQRIHVDVAGWRQSEDAVPLLPTFQEAVWQERKVRMVYRRNDGGGVERVVDPLGLVAKGSLWYLVAAIDGDLRTYRISRVVEAEMLDEACIRPPDFDLADFWARSSSDFLTRLSQHRATVRVAPPVLRQMRMAGRYARVEHEGPPSVDGWRTLRMVFEDAQGAREFVLSFGAQAEAIEPPELRDEVLQAAKGVVALYECGRRQADGATK